jgi:hypothetical protein
MDYEQTVTRFADSVREYCAWIEGPPGDAEADLFDAFRLLSRLQADAVILPDIDDEDLPEADDIPDVSHAQKAAVIQRFETFPFRYYWEIFRPITPEPEEAVCGDIVDDFADVYGDLKGALLAYDQGLRPQAVWHWRFTWGIHWGEHLTSALRALYSYQKNSE